MRRSAGIAVPKAEGVQDIVDVVARAKHRIPIFPLIETARGMRSAVETANCFVDNDCPHYREASKVSSPCGRFPQAFRLFGEQVRPNTS